MGCLPTRFAAHFRRKGSAKCPNSLFAAVQTQLAQVTRKKKAPLKLVKFAADKLRFEPSVGHDMFLRVDLQTGRPSADLPRV